MSARIGILGAGAVGARAARQLLTGDPDAHVVLADPDDAKLDAAVRSLGPRAAALIEGRIHDQGIDVLVVAAPCGHHLDPARRALRAGVSVISCSDRIEDVEALRALDGEARRAHVTILTGVGFAPGLSCVLANYGARRFDIVDEVHIAKAGTGGPACARQHHRALKTAARDWRNGEWLRRPGGSGRELVWFPEPVSGADCYRAALPDALLLRPAFLEATRITARMAATRQDRFTSWLPMLSPPHADGDVGAVRVELRGRIGSAREIRILGAVERPSIGAAAVVGAAVDEVLAGAVDNGVRGLATAVDAAEFLKRVRDRGLAAQEFEGLADLN
ncbi:MAG: Gfo/Idh/MocA family oxidoreductase [Actinomycetota bacterium]